MFNLSKFTISLFGIGFFPIGSGTIGSLFSIIFFFIFLDYLIEMFALLMKGNFLDDGSQQKFAYKELLEKISISPKRSIAVIRLLYNYKYEMRSNINKKFLYDNLLIVLNKELY